jgi:quinol monooxygenase YgiN
MVHLLPSKINAPVMKKLIFIIFILMASINVSAQVTRIARVTIDSTKLQPYMALLKEQMETAVRAEPGVISYNVYAEKASPNKLTIVEVYADNNAYLAHRETAHFKKYKAAVTDMVKSLELSEVNPVLTAKK